MPYKYEKGAVPGTGTAPFSYLYDVHPEGMHIMIFLLIYINIIKKSAAAP